MLHARACYVHDSYTYTMYIHHIQILDVHMYNTTVFSHHEQEGHTPQAQPHNEQKHTANTPRTQAHYSTPQARAHLNHTKNTSRAREHHEHTAITSTPQSHRQHTTSTLTLPTQHHEHKHTTKHTTHQEHTTHQARSTNTPRERV